jgi:hypothetical protein
MITFWEYLQDGPYSATLDTIATLVSSFRPRGFNAQADEEAYRARNDVLDEIKRLKMKAGEVIDIRRKVA